MNSLKKFTIRSLKLNKKRTTVTIIGISLSIALICAVAGVFLSFQKSMVHLTIESSGKWHALFRDAPTEAIDIVKNNRDVESFYYTQGIGYANFTSNTPHVRFFYLLGLSEQALENGGVRLESGRMPENDSEIIITTNANRFSEIEYKIGDVLSLDLFDYSVDFTFDENWNVIDEQEEFTPLFTKKVTIVGIASNVNYIMDSFERATPIITLIDEVTEDINLYVYYNNPRDNFKHNVTLANAFGLKVYESVFNNSELLRWEGSFNEETNLALYGIASVVIGIIIVTSIFVIKNGFSISITERNKEYGILASIGTTKKQIKKNVLYEGFILGLISIPLGLIIGIGAIYSLILIINSLLLRDLPTQFLYTIPYSVILISVVLGGITIYLSCLFIARKTAKSPIERIRNSENIKVKPKKLKTPKLIKKLFGVGGTIAYKNLQRNKKKYRTTVVSMILSVVIFISMSSFINYVSNESISYYYRLGFNILVFPQSIMEDEKIDELMEQIIYLIGNDEYMIITNSGANLDDKYINFDFAKYHGYDKEHENNIPVVSIDNRSFENYLKSIEKNYEDYKNKGFLVDNMRLRIDGRLVEGNLFNIDDSVTLQGRNETITIEVSHQKSTPIDDFWSYILVSEETMEKLGYSPGAKQILINSSEPYELENKIRELAEDNFWVSNHLKEQEDMQRIVLMVSIFLYGFITVITVIGLTNIINTLTTSINLRKKEFAMLKAIGTTNKEFRQMINLECIFLGTKVLIISIPIAMILSYLIYYFVARIESSISVYNPNILAIVISIVVVFLIIQIIMSYSMKRINKQNIIETIRNDNIW